MGLLVGVNCCIRLFSMPEGLRNTQCTLLSRIVSLGSSESVSIYSCGFIVLIHGSTGWIHRHFCLYGCLCLYCCPPKTMEMGLSKNWETAS